jgi:hypothetical protein
MTRFYKTPKADFSMKNQEMKYRLNAKPMN